MRFYQIIVLVFLGFCASNMETPPSARKRGFKLEFVGDISDEHAHQCRLIGVFLFIKHFHETLQMNFSVFHKRDAKYLSSMCVSAGLSELLFRTFTKSCL